MKPDITEQGAGTGPLWKRLAWFAGIWAASVATLGVIAALLRWAVR